MPVPQRSALAHAGPRRKPVAIDDAPRISNRFDEWWGIWSASRGTANRIQASHAWISVARVDWEVDIFACTSSYLASSLVVDGGGFYPQNFLFQQAQDAFRARWPPRQAPPQQPKSKIDWEQV
ncbi:MAG: hypothetical protein WDO73_25325 [Ignavibacteriota bacterium]